MHRRVAGLMAVLFAVVAGAAEPAEDPRLVAIRGLEQAIAADPADVTLRYYLAAYQAIGNERQAALANLERVLQDGDGFLPAHGVGFDGLWDDPAFRALYAGFEARLPKIDGAPVAFELADDGLVPEGIARDCTDGNFFVGSIARRKIVRVTPAGVVVDFSRPEDALDHVLGIAIDCDRRVLHAITSNAFTEAGRASPRNSVVSYDLRSGRLLARRNVPGAAQLNDLAVAADGSVYATDSAAGAVWHVADGRVAPLVAPGTLRGANGVAVSQDGEAVYVAASRRLARVDVRTGDVSTLAPPPRQTVAALDGLYLRGSSLYGVHNVTNPARVVRIHLAPGGRAIELVETIQSHHNPAFDEPTTGALGPDALYVLATTQVARYLPDGTLDPAVAAKRPKVIRIALP